MSDTPRKILVTGGAGFVGSALIRHLVHDSDYRVLNLDKMTYPASRVTLAAVDHNPRYFFVRGDICDERVVKETFASFDPDIVVHLAAECPVDHSGDGPEPYVQVNLVGTYTLLQAAHQHFRGLSPERQARFRLHHVSTDEVYGSLPPKGRFREDAPYDPCSPYAATKAGADHLVQAWGHTFGLPVLLSHCSSNYGPYQFSDQLIPLVILKAMTGEAIPVHGRGQTVRDRVFVDDHARALRCIFERGRPGETYNIGSNAEHSDLDVVTRLCAILDGKIPAKTGRPHAERITFVDDRRHNDRRFVINAAKMRRELGWRPRDSFDAGLAMTADWYLHHALWWHESQAARHGSGHPIGRTA